MEHAAGCPACRRCAAGYQILHRAILAWGKARIRRWDWRIESSRQPRHRGPTRAWRRAITRSVGSTTRWLIAAAASILAIDHRRSRLEDDRRARERRPRPPGDPSARRPGQRDPSKVPN